MKKLNYNSSIDRKYALTVGIGLVVMALAAGFSYGFVYMNIVVVGDALSTFENIQTSITLFVAGIIGWLVIFIADIVVAISLYKLLKKFNKLLAFIGAVLRLIYSGILGLSIYNLIIVFIISYSPEILSPILIEPKQNLVMLFLNGFQMVWSIGLIFFGGHLMMISYLAIKSSYLPKVISLLLFLAGVSYFIIHFNYSFLPNLNEVTKIIELFLSVPMFLGEISFAIWLLFKGGKNSKSIQNL